MELGYFAYRYKKKYYRQYLTRNTSSLEQGKGQQLADMVPRDPIALKGKATKTHWITERIYMLEHVKTWDVDNTHHGEIARPDDGINADDLGYRVTYDNEWVFTDGSSEWTYVIDLDNLAFTINGIQHLRLDSLPSDINDYINFFGSGDEFKAKYICDKVDVWPPPKFNTEECRQRYETLQPMVVSTTEWGVLTWDELSFCQQFSIELTNFIIHEKTQDISIDHAYVPSIQRHIGRFCWDVLCACIPALPIVEENDVEMLGLSPRTLSYVFHGYSRLEDKHRYGQSFGGDGERTRVNVDKWINLPGLMCFDAARAGTPYSYKAFEPLHKYYFWIRGCLVTFCIRLAEPVYVEHEVEQMVQKLRLDGSAESVGIILSSQQELVVVAVDRLQVRHTPVLDIRPVDSRPGKASDGRLLLTRLLSPLFTAPPLPWRIQPHQSPNSTANLPSEVIQIIINHVDMGTYVALCQVSRFMRSVCFTYPRVGYYTVLRKVPGSGMVLVARDTNGSVTMAIKLRGMIV